MTGVQDAAARAAPAGGSGTTLRARIALYATAAALLFLLERLLPNPIPWFRLGLANVVTLVVLVEHGPAAALAVFGVRLVLGGLFTGTLFGPQFLLAATGGAASWLVMAAAVRWGARVWSPFGISLLGATAHAVVQLAVANALFASADQLWVLLPMFLGLAIVAGGIIGFLAAVVLGRLALARHPDHGRAP